MQFEFEYTKADLAESSQQIDKRGRVVKTRRNIYRWFVFALCAFAFNVLLDPHGFVWTDRKLPTQNLWVTLAPALTPSCIFLFAILFFTFDNWRRTRNALSNNSSPVDQPPLKFGVLLLMLPFAFMILPIVPDFAIDWKPTPGGAIWVSLLPWIAFAIVFALIGLFGRRLSVARNFAQRRSLHRPHKIELNADAVIIESGPGYQRLQWGAFDRYSETQNLLKLITEDEATILFPNARSPTLTPSTPCVL